MCKDCTIYYSISKSSAVANNCVPIMKDGKKEEMMNWKAIEDEDYNDDPTTEKYKLLNVTAWVCHWFRQDDIRLGWLAFTGTSALNDISMIDT